MNDQHPHEEDSQLHCTDPKRFLEILHGAGGLFEIRIINCPERVGGSFVSTVAGWFNCPEKAAQAIRDIENRKPPAVYVSVNPVEPALLSRSANRCQSKVKATTKDSEIARRHCLFVDIDSKRPSGCSATDEELAAASELSDRLLASMRDRGWPEPLQGMSGNGRYLLWRVDLPNDDSSKMLIQSCLNALGRFDTDGAEVDCSTFNAARICKVLGTWARKGDPVVGLEGIADRPHRQSWFIEPEEPLEVVPVELLQALADEASAPEGKAFESRVVSNESDTFDRCCKYLSKMPPAVAGELGHQKLYRAACVALHDFRLPDADAVQAIEQGFNPTCAPSWDHADIKRAIDKARSTGGPSPGFGSKSIEREALGVPEEWPEPQPLPSPLPEVQPYSDDLLPPAVRDAVSDIADRMQCPPDFAAASMLVALASVIGCRVGIRPRRFDDWLVVPNLWGCVVGRPSLKKSPAVAHAEKRIRALESRERERLAEEIRQYQVGAILSDARAKVAKAAIEKAVKSGDVTGAEGLAEEMVNSDDEGPPVPRRIITSDATIEKVGEMLNRHPAGLCLWVDELVGWMRGLDREDKAGVRQQFLTMWNGVGRLNIDRVGRGETIVESPCLSVFGCATPGGIAEYVSSCVRGGRGDDGFLQRLQILVWPDAPREFVHVDRWPDSDVRKALASVFEALWDMEPNEFASRDEFDDGSGIPWLRFDDAGQAVFDAWETEIQSRIRAEDMPEAFESHLAKYASMVPSIALILHLTMGNRGPVGREAAVMAVRWSEYLESHTERLYSIATTPARRCAQPLLKRLLQWPEEVPIRSRTIAKKGWSGLSDSKAVEETLEFLVDHGWLRGFQVKSEKGTKGGRSTIDYHLHPKAADYFETLQVGATKTGETPVKDSFGGFGGADSKEFEKIAPPSERIRGVL